MTTRLCSLLLVLAASSAAAVNFSGKWAIQNPAGRGGGRGAPPVLVLNQVGSEVTGTLSARIDAGSASPINTEIFGGKVDGEVLTFYVWTGTDQPAKTSYRGTLSPSGEEIIFTVTASSGNPVTVAARRTK